MDVLVRSDETTWVFYNTNPAGGLTGVFDFVDAKQRRERYLQREVNELNHPLIQEKLRDATSSRCGTPPVSADSPLPRRLTLNTPTDQPTPTDAGGEHDRTMASDATEPWSGDEILQMGMESIEQVLEEQRRRDEQRELHLRAQQGPRPVSRVTSPVTENISGYRSPSADGRSTVEPDVPAVVTDTRRLGETRTGDTSSTPTDITSRGDLPVDDSETVHSSDTTSVEAAASTSSSGYSRLEALAEGREPGVENKATYPYSCSSGSGPIGHGVHKVPDPHLTHHRAQKRSTSPGISPSDICKRPKFEDNP